MKAEMQTAMPAACAGDSGPTTDASPGSSLATVDAPLGGAVDDDDDEAACEASVARVVRAVRALLRALEVAAALRAASSGGERTAGADVRVEPVVADMTRAIDCAMQSC
jgi:hypothetical protein